MFKFILNFFKRLFKKKPIEPPPLCINCKYCIPNKVQSQIHGYSKCVRPKNGNIKRSLVDGRELEDGRIDTFCDMERGTSDGCGSKGKYFVNKHMFD